MKKNLFNNNLNIKINENLELPKNKIIMAGPCAIESYEQLLETAKLRKNI